MLNRREWILALCIGNGCMSALAQSPEAVLRREAAARERVRMGRFDHQGQVGLFQVGAMFTGRTVMASAHNVFVRDHLVVEVLLVPPHSDGIPLNLGLLQLRVNDERDPRMPQTPELVGYYIRTEQDAQRGRLQASAGIGGGGIVLDTGGQRRGRFPGDPRTPRPTEAGRNANPPKQDPLDADADLVLSQAFRGGVVHQETAGFLYYPCDLDLRKIRKLELLVFGEGETKPPLVLRLK